MNKLLKSCLLLGLCTAGEEFGTTEDTIASSSFLAYFQIMEDAFLLLILLLSLEYTVCKIPPIKCMWEKKIVLEKINLHFLKLIFFQTLD